MGSKKNKGKNQQQQQPQKKKGMMITEEHMMDKTHMDTTKFSPYLPQDSFYPPYPINSKQIRTILTDLNYLLYLDFKNFWATILYNPSLKDYLQTSLTYFHRRWLNRYLKKTEQQSKQVYQDLKSQSTYQYTQALFQITLTIYYRILNFQTENAELSRIYNLKDAIQIKYIFDVPKLLELIQVYGQSNADIVRNIVKNYTKLVNNFYSLMMNESFPYLNKRVYGNIMEFKLVTDRQQFGVNYSYQRKRNDELSPGEQQLRRKTKLLMQSISYIETIKNVVDFLPEDCGNNLYFNHEVHLILQNIFYELEAAYKVWDWHQQKQCLLPMVNFILKSIKQYFIQFFKRLDSYMLKKDRKCRTIQAYLKALQRILKDYGRRISLGRKQKVKILVLYGQIIKDYDLIDFLNRLYLSECQQPEYEINIDFLVDFKLQLQNAFDPQKKQKRQIAQRMLQIEEQETVAGQQAEIMQPQISQAQINAIKQLQLKTSNDRQARELEMIIPKKNRQENYYEKLYTAYNSKINIHYDDQYDDLVDYEKKPLFIDQQSSNSQSQDEEAKHRPNNQNNPQLNRKASERGRKVKQNEKGFVKMNQKQSQSMVFNSSSTKEIKQKPRFDERGKPKYQQKNKQQEKGFKKNKQVYVQKNKDEEKQQEKQNNIELMDDQPNCKMSIRFQNEAQQRQFKKANRQFQVSATQEDTSRKKDHNYHRGKPNNHWDNDKGPKGGNKNKKKYHQK